MNEIYLNSEGTIFLPHGKNTRMYVTDSSNETNCLREIPKKYVKNDSNLCTCHTNNENWKSNKTREAVIKLSFAAFLAIIFALAEAIGGYLSSSLAILTDSAHMLSDFFGFIVSLTSLFISRRKATNKMHYGYHRAEVLGAVFSVVIIWIVTALLVYEGIQRIIHLDYDINADVMLITATAGLYINVLLSLVLQIPLPKFLLEKNDIGKDNVAKVENINIRAALIHCIGDIVQSVGVIIAGLIIRFRPDLKIADPICTFIFSILVTITTLNILRDAVHILMEGAPASIKVIEVRAYLISIPEVKRFHDLRIWNLNSTRICLSVHLAVDITEKYDVLLDCVINDLKRKYSIDYTTIQLEFFNPDEYTNCTMCSLQDKYN